MICNKCGQQLLDNQEYCHKCGSKISEAIDAYANTIESKDSEYPYNHYLNVLLIYFIVIYFGVSIIQLILMGLFKNLYDQPIYFDDGIINPICENFVIVWTQISLYSILAVVIISMLIKSVKFDLGSFFRNRKKIIIKALIGLGLMYLVNYACNIVFTLLGLTGASGNQSAIEDILFSSGTVPMVLYMLTIAFAAPIVEELIFRKAMFSYFKKFNYSIKKRIIISGIAFGALHVISTIISLATTGAGIESILIEILYSAPYIGTGFVLGYIYADTDENIVTPTIAHILNNAISCIALLALQKM